MPGGTPPDAEQRLSDRLESLLARYDERGAGWKRPGALASSTEEEGYRRMIAHVNSTNGRAWALFGEAMDELYKLPEVQASEEVTEFVLFLGFASVNALMGGIDALLEQFEGAQAARAARARRKAGDDRRDLIRDEWANEIRLGSPLRGRIKRIAEACGCSPRTVRDHLAQLGLHQPKSRKGS